MNLPDFLTELPEGEIMLAGHRIGLYHVIERYNEGESAEMLASRYPTLRLALVYKVIAFYLDNQGEVDKYLVSCADQLRAQESESKHLSLDTLRQRLATKPQTAPAR